MASDVILGWDIGGAHLKVAALRDQRVVRVVCLPAPLWLGLDHLDRALHVAHAAMPRARSHAITMTGELSDGFRDRAQGVRVLLARFARANPAGTVGVFAGAAGFVSAGRAARETSAVASANWMASGQLVAARVRNALFVDIGSTTTDLVPVRAGGLRVAGFSDAERLSSNELVYAGVVRTSLMALVRTIRFRGRGVPVMAEHFATIADVYRLTGELPAGADLLPAADGGAKSVRASARRLARMIGRDLDAASMREWAACARAIADSQLDGLEVAARRVLGRARLPADAPVVAAGVGRFLANRLARRLGRRYRDFATLIPHAANAGPRLTDCAPAAAVAVLLGEQE